MKQFLWDDGSPVDRSSESFSRSSRKSAKFKARDAAVSRQAERILLIEILAFPGVTAVHVSSADGVSRLNVQITAAADDLPDVQELVMARAPALRRAITASLRRKAPDLSFTFFADGGAQ